MASTLSSISSAAATAGASASSRRGFLTMMSGGNTAGLSASGKSLALSEADRQNWSDIRALNPRRFGYWEANHLLNRAGFGGTTEQVKLLADWGLEKSVDYLVDYVSVPTQDVRADTFDGNIMRELTPDERRALEQARRAQDEDTVQKFRIMRQEQQRKDRQQIHDMQEWWLKRMIETPRPLEEKMTLFFHGHFATSYRKIENSYHMFLQNQLYRKYAVGNFAELAFQVIRDPAMLAYLDNNDSRKEHANENLSREFMELFTLGEGDGYTEDDVKQAAKALTGYTFRGNDFLFRPDWHDAGSKRIFGQTGTFNGDDFVRMVLGKTYCSEYIAYKLYRFFVNDLPNGLTPDSKSFILALAQAMRQSRYNLAPVLKTLFTSEHFYDTKNIASQIKSPVQLTVQAIRSLRTPVTDMNILLEAQDLMGQNILFPPSVKGWDGGRTWINTSTVFVRQNLLTHLLTGKLPNGASTSHARPEFNALSLIAGVDKRPNGEYDPDKSAEYLLKMSFGAEPHEDRTTTMREFLKARGNRISNDVVVGMLCVITAMPEYQLC